MHQLDRSRRYLKRLRDIYHEVPYTPDTRDYYADDVFSFFIHCYHVRDWIIQLNKACVTRPDVDAFIDSHIELRICADLCNGTKHCTLTHKSRTVSQPHLAMKSFCSKGTNDQMTSTRGKFWIIADGHFHDALELAERCMALWDEFILQIESAPECLPLRERLSLSTNVGPQGKQYLA